MKKTFLIFAAVVILASCATESKILGWNRLFSVCEPQ